MTRRRPFDATHHAAYMTRIVTELAKLTEVESPDANIITTDPDVTDISPSSSEFNRRVEQQLNFPHHTSTNPTKEFLNTHKVQEEDETPNQNQKPS
jgi:hypothetical protein